LAVSGSADLNAKLLDDFDPGPAAQLCLFLVSGMYPDLLWAE